MRRVIREALWGAMLLACVPGYAAEKGLSLKASFTSLKAQTLASIDEEETRFQFIPQASWYICRSKIGFIGRNSVPLPKLRANRQGDCADFTGAVLEDYDLKGAALDGADLNHARLARAQLKGARLKWADVNYADLQRADLEAVAAPGARFVGGPARRRGARQRQPRAHQPQGSFLGRRRPARRPPHRRHPR
ncbi:MAG: hypothetical protein FD126_2367 [Elusimicrobia bacterium]|nr:MAG: hypothetical protein FD126_2367 [Elusimicrobiota bacterium]